MSPAQIAIAVVAALIVPPLLGGLLRGVDRKITARMQGRVGPPVQQPFYDIIKLFNKSRITTTWMQLFFIYGYLLLIVAAVILFALLGWALVRRRPWALTLSIFVQGFNVIVRIMMLLPRIVVKGQLDVAWLVTSLLAVILSGAFLLLLEKPEVQIAITA